MLIDLTKLPQLSRRTKASCIRWNMEQGGTTSAGKGNRALRKMGGTPFDPPVGHLCGMNRAEFAGHFGFKHPDTK